MAWDDKPPTRVELGGWDSTPPTKSELTPSLPERASRAIQSLIPNLTMPNSPLDFLPQSQFNNGKQVLNAGIAADKNYPAQNLLPAAGATVGSIVGGAATLPSGAGVPFGATIGATIGGQVGDTARQYINILRGNPDVAKTPLDAVKETAKTGAEMGAAEIGTSAVLKGLEALGVTKLVRNGFGKMSDFLMNETKPADNEAVRNMIGKYAQEPVSETNDTKNFVKDILDKRGINIGEKKATTLTPTQLQNLKDGGLSDQEIEELSNSGIGLEGSIQSLFSSANAKPKLSSDLKTPSLTEYKGLANIYQDLSNPKLTYGKLKQMQSAVGDMANFESSERTGMEKIYGKIYNKIGSLLDQTAEKGGFTEAHSFAQDNGRKYFQNRFLSNIMEDSRDFLPGGPQINYGKLASKLNQYGDKELENIFGDNTKYIETLRDLANHAAKVEKQSVYSRITARGMPTASLKIGGILDKLNAPENIKTILTRNLGDQASQFSPDLFPFLPTARQAVKTGAKAKVGINILPNENP